MDIHPGVEISIDVSNKLRVIEGLNQNESDFSLVSVLPKGIDVNQVSLMENRLYLAGHKQHQGKIKTPKDLEKVTLLFREQGSATRSAMEEYLNSQNVKVGKSMELVSNEAVKQAINAGIGFSIVPLIGLRTSLISENIRIYKLRGLPIITRWNLIYNKRKRLTPAQQALIDFIETNKGDVVEQHFNWNEFAEVL